METPNSAVLPPEFDYRDFNTLREELERLPWWKRFLLHERGYVSIGYRQPKGFRAPMKFFILFCKKGDHYLLTYPHGHDGRIECAEHDFPRIHGATMN
ncbi:MAG: hypothetical protein HYT22_03045 [Candidatus Niyogibacteria bacterium]|nr:hypothetical protein [Candidatus Niyogibacteria bacterium]